MRLFDGWLAKEAVVGDPPTAPMPLEPAAGAGATRAVHPDPGADEAAPLIFQRVESPAAPVFDELCQLLCRDAGYWSRTYAGVMTPRVAADVLRALPPGVDGAAKYLWALRRDGQLVGCLDVLRHWPTRSTLSIGLMMIAPDWRGRGLGRATLERLRARTGAWSGVRRWRVAVVETQADARRFWRSTGFAETGQRQAAGAHRAPLVVMERVEAGG